MTNSRRDRSPVRFRALSATGIRDNLRRRSLSRRRRSSSLQKHQTDRLGIDPTLYGVNEVYVEGEPTENIVLEKPTPDSKSLLFRGARKTPYGKTWNESKGVVAPMPETPSSSPDRNQKKTNSAIATPPTAGMTPLTPKVLQPRAKSSSIQHRRSLEAPITPIAIERVVTPARPSTPSSAVNIFLLLVEPHTKVFELIDLTYPRLKTTIGDLLRMIPRHATLPSLTTQRYIGLTRPYKKHDPLTDLRMLASNSVFHAKVTADLRPGEVVLAIPAHTSARNMVQLAKPILANPKIQQMLGRTPTKKSSSSSNRSASRNSVESRCTVSMMTMVSTTPVVEDEPYVTPARVADDVLLNRDIVCTSDDCFFDFCEQKIVANTSSATSTTPFRPAVDQFLPNNETVYHDTGSIGSHSLQEYNTRLKLWSKQLQARKRRATKTASVAAPMFWLASVVWYRLDRSSAALNLELRAQPLGWKGFLIALACGILLVKWQWLVLAPSALTLRCPVLQLLLVVIMHGGGGADCSD